jgi:branched-chain amino acid transport system ATP-binding protein
MMLLRLEGVGKNYGGVAALRGLSFSVAAGEIVGLMGANGAGKTTAFSLIAGTQQPSHGEIWFDGKRIDGKRAHELSRLGIGRTFQLVRPFSDLTVRGNIAVGALYGRQPAPSRAVAEARAEEILNEVHLAKLSDRLPGTLTLAQRKRLEIARALATSPRLLLLDEVLAGLNAAEADEAFEMIRAVHAAHELTIIIIEHVMRALMRLCGRVVVLHHGEKIAEGTPQDVAADPRVVDSYFGARAS